MYIGCNVLSKVQIKPWRWETTVQLYMELEATTFTMASLSDGLSDQCDVCNF